MNIRPFTLSVVVGSAACNARCPFCVSRMTIPNGVELRPTPIDWRNWEQTIALCERAGVSTVLITSKGEPTLFPEQIMDTLLKLRGRIPIVELQTNALRIADGTINDVMLKTWFREGLRVILISNVGPDMELNRRIYTPHGEYMDMAAVVGRCKALGFTVRLTTVMIKGGVENITGVKNCIEWARTLGADQLTVRSVETPTVIQPSKEAARVAAWAEVQKVWVKPIYEWLEKEAVRLLELPHGAVIYDYKGQNVSLANCLTESTKDGSIRQLIYFPDGHLRYSWQHEGAILL